MLDLELHQRDQALPFRDEVRSRGEGEDEHQHEEAGEDARQAAHRARLEVDRRAGEGARRREAADERRADVADGLADELAVGVERVPRPRRQRLLAAPGGAQ